MSVFFRRAVYFCFALSGSFAIFNLLEWWRAGSHPVVSLLTAIFSGVAALAGIFFIQSSSRVEENLEDAEHALRRANGELIDTYDRTLEGWAKALDLRDQNTHHHCRRVVELTIRLAYAMGVDPEQMIHIRRGALLHDIGKMGLPDSVLLKNGPLSDEEWTIMRLHPTYAFQLLSPIEYLRPALDIPYCHHEKWNGSGYPRGLKGEEIPLIARLFSVVDIWDALTSERPYHAPWPEEKVRVYLKSLAGDHLDPIAVEKFLALDLSSNAAPDPIKSAA